MASEDMGIFPTQRMDNHMSSHLLFPPRNPLRFSSSPPVQREAVEPGSKPGFTEDKLLSTNNSDRYFSPELRRGGEVFGEAPDATERGDVVVGRIWNRGGSGSSPSSGENDEDEEDDDDGGVEGLVGLGGVKNSVVGDKIGCVISKDLTTASFGSSVRQMMKDGVPYQLGAEVNRASTSENGQQGRVGPFQQMVTIAGHDSEVYYPQLLQTAEGSSQGQKDIAGDNGCGISGRKDGPVCSDPAESLRAIFSDPITGTLMDDAMILPCGHSFGGGGIQQVIKMKACYTCSHPVSEGSVAPNLSLRTAVQAFRREEDLLMYRASKRRRERFEQDKGNLGDPSFSDTPRGRGVQFPFAVTDRVIIKGNKRTPQRFVGREAVVTTQCLNGWYVVKTLDNAESVKLQYRSLEKVPDNASSRPTTDKMTPSWL